MRFARYFAQAGIIAAVVLLAGCSSPGTSTTASTPRQLSQPQLTAAALKAPCSQTKSPRHLADHHVIAAFPLAAVIECEYDNLQIPGHGSWSVLIRQVSGTGLERLKAVLSQSDTHKPLPPHSGCAAVGYLPLRILLTNGAGRYLQPHTPSDTCGAPLPDVYPTVNQIIWRTVSITRLSRTQPDPPSIDACATDTRSAVQQSHAREASSGAANLQLNPDPGGLTACLYYSLDDAGDGRMARLVKLPIAPSEIAQLLGGPPPPSRRTCPTQNRFAVLHDRHHHALTMEIGGCWRIARETSAPVIIGTAPPSYLRRMLRNS